MASSISVWRHDRVVARAPVPRVVSRRRARRLADGHPVGPAFDRGSRARTRRSGSLAGTCRSPALAAQVARYLIIDSRPSQGTCAISDHLAHDDAIVKRFERWARRHLGDRFSLEDAARAVGASERTLARRLRAVLGKMPLGYVQDLRVERALHRLKTSSDSVDVIAVEVGYSDGVTLRTLLRGRPAVGSASFAPCEVVFAEPDHSLDAGRLPALVMKTSL